MKITSKNKKIVLVSDIHHEYKMFKKIWRHESPDYMVCLGDWFDSKVRFDDEHVVKTAEKLKMFMAESKNNISLFGNHDLHYFSDNLSTYCSGYSPHRKKIIREILGNDFENIKNRFQWHIFVDDYLCTHAGLHPAFVPDETKTHEQMDDWLKKEGADATKALFKNKDHWFYRAGYARGGEMPFGGVVWLDYDDEFQPIEGINQIFGHTHRRTKQIGINRSNYCIDTGLHQYIVICDGKLKFADTIDI